MNKPGKDAMRSVVYPSMQALRMLDAVARFRSMQHAADHLSVTPSAVSHQIRNLEEQIGAKLVRKVGRRIDMTSAGNRYAREIRTALEIVARASLPVGENEPQGTLVISAKSGFGAFWLAKNIGEFVSLYPKIDVEVLSVVDSNDAPTDNVDVSICYGDGYWSGMVARLLVAPRFYPVCSPKLLETTGQLAEPSDVLNFQLIHHTDYGDWATWLAKATKKEVKLQGGLVFSDVTHCMSTAIAGHGIAIGDDVMSGPAIADGTLMRLFTEDVAAPQSYYVVTDEERAQRQVCRTFLNWLGGKFPQTGAGAGVGVGG